ncbi:hypothetical protein Aph01nite_52210 [Acrocarpospora phusangensis]|uniref:ABC3 transporter permease C-terminal domain-containing protein n=1 Tax=Acrocarpospora phusangensis TaxID=1070424 RepID=A0A919UM38_9ACTN|nr:FtsX-like permease family protein [Acrocarpospora phusangensis]GIH26911.1 hypothetical protein Aph01nite_52210 [Acrocarpospora phusangensis]
MIPVAALWLRLELGRRRRTLLVLGLLVAFAGATVLTSLAGARRGDGVADRLLAVVPAGRAAMATIESACLAAFGLAALLAAVVLIGQAVIRYASAGAAELRALVALGLTRRQGTGLSALAPAVATLAGSIAAAGLAVAASSWMPFGVAADHEPAPGVDVDWLVLGAGLVLTPALAAGAAAVSAWVGLAAPGRTRPGRRSAVVGAMSALGLPVGVVVGTRFALEPGRGRYAVPVRPALVGAVTGVLGVLAAFTFSAGVADAAGNPARFGQNYQLMAIFGSDGRDFQPPRPVLSALAEDPDVTGATDLRIGAGRIGRLTVLTHSFDPVGEAVPLVLTEGRPPAVAEEVVLAPASARQLGAAVGGTVTLGGDLAARELTVTGIGFGVETSTRGYESGAWVTSDGYDVLFSGFKEHGSLLALRAGADRDAVANRLRQRLGGGLLIFTPVVPRQFGEIRHVQVLPLVLGGFLALLAVGAVGHALITAVRRRGHDLAVLRALGMTRGQCRLVVVTQACAITLLGLLAGVPLGMALGRILWRAAAGIMPVQYHPPTSPWTLILIAPLALLITALLATGPGRHAGHRNLGQALRAE